SERFCSGPSSLSSFLTSWHHRQPSFTFRSRCHLSSAGTGRSLSIPTVFSLESSALWSTVWQKLIRPSWRRQKKSEEKPANSQKAAVFTNCSGSLSSALLWEISSRLYSAGFPWENGWFEAVWYGEISVLSGEWPWHWPQRSFTKI